MTKVVFRKIKNHDSAHLGDGIIAFFPETRNNGDVLSYMHHGQHGDASLEFYRKDTAKASPEEYKSLLSELENLVGYDDLRVMQRLQA